MIFLLIMSVLGEASAGMRWAGTWPRMACSRAASGGLKKNQGIIFWKKTKPLALRCQTRYIQAHDLGGIAMRYLDCPEDSFPWKIRQLLEHGSTAIDPAVAQLWHDLIGFHSKLLS